MTTRKRETICVGDYEEVQNENNKKKRTIVSIIDDDSCKFLPEELIIDSVLTRKRAIICADDHEEEQKSNKKKEETTVSISDDDSCKFLSEELIIDNVLTRLPFRSLARFSCISKYWYNSIFNDTRFAAQHFANQKNNRNIIFSLLNAYEEGLGESCCIFKLQQKQNDNEDVFVDYELLSKECSRIPTELVGYCNGLACVAAINGCESDSEYGGITVINPARNESITLLYLNPITIRGGGNGTGLYLCHGFGFDSSSQQYKVVVIYITTAAAANVHQELEQEFVCMVYTLGGTKWRKIVTRISEISPPPQPASSSFPHRRILVTRAWRKYCRSATLCGGDLYWRITNDNRPFGGGGDNLINDTGRGINYGEDMLLSFDIHSEKIQFIQLPTECGTGTVKTTIQPDLVVDHHLLEFKGYPCVAISEKTMKSNRDHRRYHPRRHFCCCHFEVRMYVLKDKANQVWTKEEFFEVTFRDTMLRSLPPPFSRCCFETITTTTPPTRILSFSDQVALYWFDGECLVYYNFQMNGLKVVKGSMSSSGKEVRDIFEAKMKGIFPGRSIGEDGNSHCPYMDYQLHAQVENILSMKTFIPQAGETMLKFESSDDFQEFFTGKEEHAPAGWLITGRKLAKYDVFY